VGIAPSALQIETVFIPWRAGANLLEPFVVGHKPMKLSRLLTSVAAAFSLLGVAGRAADAPKVGDPAPDFEMKGSDGKTYKLSEFKNKKAVVVAWYPKAFTGG
jgi:hypothetical protein